MPDPNPTLPEIAAFLADVQLTREAGGSPAAVAARHPGMAATLAAATPPTPQPAPVLLVQQSAVPARPWGQYLAVGAGGAAVLLPVLMTVTALLVALGMAALAMTVMALVVRWLVRDMRRA